MTNPWTPPPFPTEARLEPSLKEEPAVGDLWLGRPCVRYERSKDDPSEVRSVFKWARDDLPVLIIAYVNWMPVGVVGSREEAEWRLALFDDEGWEISDRRREIFLHTRTDESVLERFSLPQLRGLAVEPAKPLTIDEMDAWLADRTNTPNYAQLRAGLQAYNASIQDLQNQLRAVRAERDRLLAKYEPDPNG